MTVTKSQRVSSIMFLCFFKFITVGIRVIEIYTRL